MSMETRSRSRTLQPQLITGWGKFLRDVGSVFEIKFIMFARSWYWYLIGALVFPVGMFYFARALAPDSPDAVRRAMVGTIGFGATMMTTNMLAQAVIQDRFEGRLKLIITMPVSRISYAGGSASVRCDDDGDHDRIVAVGGRGRGRGLLPDLGLSADSGDRNADAVGADALHC